MKPHYAVKCNPDPEIIAKLASLGAGFDCASPAEIELVLAAGGAPIIYANPCKTNKDIAFAKTNAVSLTTVDSLCELEKIHRIYPEMSLILRIFASDTSAQCVLSNKYGAIEKEWEPILQRARELSMNFAGISFHVGSGAMNPAAFTGAIAQARKLYELGCKYGFAMTLIDIGGGFSVKNFVDMSATIKAALACHFPSAPAATRFTFMAEPGRFFAENVATLLTKVINVRERDGVRDYWLNDGLYGSFNCVLYDHIKLKPFPLKAAAAPKTLATLWGPTCDGFDKICENIELLYLNCDDWLLWTNMGAYTIAGSCNFNGIAAMQPNKIYIN